MLQQYGIIIVLPYFIRSASDVVVLVHRLRTDLYWEGRFVVVTEDGCNAGRLQEVSLVGESIDGTRFRQVPGHVVLAAPIRISELIAVILNGTDVRVSLEYWHFKLLASSQAAQLNRYIKKAERARHTSQIGVSMARICREIIISLDLIDWSLVASSEEGHALSKSAHSFLDEYLNDDHLTSEKYEVILKKAKELLARSAFPFPSED